MASSINQTGNMGKHLTNEAEDALRKLQRGDLRFCTFKLIGEGTIDIDVVSPSETTEAPAKEEQWARFVAAFPHDECRYGLSTFPFTSQSDGVTRSKMVYVTWAPGACKVKDRMLLSVFVKVVSQNFQQNGGSVTANVEAADVSDLEFSDVEAKIRVKTTVK